MSEDKESQGPFLFGRDLSRIPCYRSSMMNGIGGGIVSGLGFFLYTSNPKRATNFGFMAFVGLTLVSWTVCRSTRNTSNVDEQAIKKALQAKILTEGTQNDIEKEIESQTKEV